MTEPPGSAPEERGRASGDRGEHRHPSDAAGHRGPAWWPAGEPWPPPGWSGHGRRHGRGWHGARGAGGRWRPFGCLFVLFGLFAAGTIVVGIWAAAAIAGLVDAPAIVVAAGIVAFVIVAIGMLAAAAAFRRLTRPLDALIDAASRIEAGDYGVRVDESGTREMRSLARAFNGMSEQLEVADQRRRSFLAEATHELRTPLTVMQGQLEAIEDGVYPPDRDRMAALLAQTRSMTRLVADLHTISLAEVGGLRLQRVPTPVGDLLEEVAVAHAPAAQLAGIELVADVRPSTPAISVDVAATRRILGNIVSNAIRHAGARHVRLDASAAGEVVLIEVHDDGAGIEPERIGAVFERFERGSGSDGSGLGLAIAKDLAEAQGGSIRLRSERGAGTTVEIRLPVVGP